MLIQEAQWFAEQLALMEPAQVFPICNVGSSTEGFRTQDQPWIDELIFAPVVRQEHFEGLRGFAELNAPITIDPGKRESTGIVDALET